jgi:hypothetical protein
LDGLGIHYLDSGLHIKCECPCQHHDGDRSSKSFNWKKDIGHWICWSHHCEEKYGSDIIGLVRSITGKSFVDTKKYLQSFVDDEGVVLDVDYTVPKKNPELYIHKPLPENHLKWLSKQPRYLLERGFSSEILDEYAVGLWTRLGTFMHDRVVVPVRDHEGFLVCYSGRTIHKEEWFQNKGLDYKKWLHGRSYFNFPKQNELFTGSILFNLNKAKNHIRPNNNLILVEGPLDGFKLSMAGIYNWVCPLGTSFGTLHRSLLVKYGINNLFVAFDNDKAGKKAFQRLKRIIGDLINLYEIELPEDKDPGSLSVQEIRNIFHDKT